MTPPTDDELTTLARAYTGDRSLRVSVHQREVRGYGNSVRSYAVLGVGKTDDEARSAAFFNMSQRSDLWGAALDTIKRRLRP